MPPRRDLPTRCKTTFSSQKSRAKKYGATLTYTADDLVAIVPERCPICGRKLTPATINFDHKVALTRGGEWTLENLQAICASCNRRKGALNENEYAFLLTALSQMTSLFGDYAEKNILARIAAGGAYIHG